MLTKRIIACLDIKDGRVVKGTNFQRLKDAGDPYELAKKYYLEGIDELSLLDITASYENRTPLINLIQKLNQSIFIPLSVGGGIRSLTDAQTILHAGAEKVSLGTAAVRNPELISKIVEQYGSQAVIVSLDIKKVSPSLKIPSGYEVYIYGGRTPTALDGIQFAQNMEALGAGELLLNSIDNDGMKHGFNLSQLREFSESCNLPIIASGGAGKLEHFYSVFTEGQADAALAASIFHYNLLSVSEIKSFLKEKQMEVRTL